jgi:AMP nucleosidase
VEVGRSRQEIPFPYVLDGAEFGLDAAVSSDLARWFPTTELAHIGDEIPDGVWRARDAYPLALFDALRTDFSLARLRHYTGTPAEHVQGFVLLTNYHRYVDEFVRWGCEQLRQGGIYTALSCAGGALLTPETADPALAIADGAWRRHQMPGYHLIGPGGQGCQPDQHRRGAVQRQDDHGPPGGAAPARLADDRPLRRAAALPAHRRLCAGSRLPARRPRPGRGALAWRSPSRPSPRCSRRCRRRPSRSAARAATRSRRASAPARWSPPTTATGSSAIRQSALLFTQSRAVAIDMESATIAAQGYRFRVPYGTLLCLSDKPLHGEIKLPGQANRFYERAISEHIRIGIAAADLLRKEGPRLHSRKLRAFNEPPFR